MTDSKLVGFVFFLHFFLFPWSSLIKSFHGNKHHTEIGWLNILSPNLAQELTPLPFFPYSSASKAPFGFADASYVHNLPVVESSHSLLLLLLPLN